MPHFYPAPEFQSGSQWIPSHLDGDSARQCHDNEPMALLLHELRSPLASIRNALAVLRLRGTDESLRQRMHELIERQVRQIALLTSSTRQMSGITLENLQLQRERVNLGVVLRMAIETVTPELADRLNELVVTFPEANTWVSGDASRLEQVFINLLSNASKYSDLGGQIMISLRTADRHAIVSVRDSGIGIAVDALPHIFDLYARADSTETRTRTGLGVGLALVRSILDAHYGTVSAASAGPGQGSEFTVRLRLAS
jgi:signal transduction histidine kinase